jgi:hypothetical protein
MTMQDIDLNAIKGHLEELGAKLGELRRHL